MPSLQEIRTRLGQLNLDNEYGYRQEIRRIPECLDRNETLRGITSGLHKGKRWYLLCTEERCLLLTKPTLGDPELIAFPRKDIVAVKARRGLIFGTVTLETANTTYTFTNVLKKSLPTFMDAMNTTGGGSHFSEGDGPFSGPPPARSR